MQKDAPGATGHPNTIILQGQWESAIVKDESTWLLEDGKLVLDIRKRVEGLWKVCCYYTLLFRCGLIFSLQILIRSGINGDDSLIDPLSRVILGIAAAENQDHVYALQCYERSADEGSWHAMRKLAALFVFPSLVIMLILTHDDDIFAIARRFRFSCVDNQLAARSSFRLI
jgi:hypothetical protein